jgi:transcriptional regulator of acetoin/glycerol metabolism
MESLNDGLVVLDSNGRVVYANEHARQLAGRDLTGQRGDAVRVRLIALGGSSVPLRSGGLTLGEAIFLPRSQPARTLAERERQAIVDTLSSARGRLAETARRLGISRTTLWRRLRAYGIRPSNGHARAVPPRA